MIRPARQEDVPEMVAMVRELAEYERAVDQVVLDEAMLEAALFAEPIAARALVAEDGGAIAGMALWFPTFSTWTGRPGIWLEDLYVRPEARSKGLGRALLARLAAIAREHNWERVEWAVLDWNEPALGFYEALGAHPLKDWTTHRLTGSELEALAATAR